MKPLKSAFKKRLDSSIALFAELHDFSRSSQKEKHLLAETK